MTDDTNHIDWTEMHNHGALAAWMLRLVDESPDRLAIIEVPHSAVRTDDTSLPSRPSSSASTTARRPIVPT